MDTEIFDNLLDRIISQSIELDRAKASAAESATRIAAVLADRRVDVADVFTLMLSMAGGKGIEAIKAYRSLTGAGLKESKDAVEAVMERDRSL